MREINFPVMRQRTIYPRHELLVDSTIRYRKTWVDEWEWRYDFSDIWADIRRSTLIIARKLWRWAGGKLGYNIYEDGLTYEYEKNWITINNLDEALKRIPDLARRMMNEPLMIVVGPDAYEQIMRMEQDFLTIRHEFSVHHQRDYQRTILYFDLPVVFSKYASGITILPDYTGQARLRNVGWEDDIKGALERRSWKEKMYPW